MQSPLKGLRASGDAWREVRDLVGVSRWKVLGYGALGAVVGVTEAMFLALLASAGVALASGGDPAIKLPLVTLTNLSVGAMLGVGAALALTTLAAQVEFQRGIAQINARSVAKLRQDAYDAFIATSWEVQADQAESEFGTLMVSHIPRAANVLVALINQLNGLVTVGIFVAIAVSFSPVVAGSVVVAGAALSVFFLPLQTLTRRAGKETAAATATFFAQLGDAVGAGRDVKAYGVEEQMRSRLRDEIERVERPTYRGRLLQGIVPVVYQRIVLLLVLLAMSVAAMLEVGDLETVGAALLLLLRALQKGQNVQASQIQIAEILPWVTEVRDRFAYYHDRRVVAGDAVLDAVDTIELDRVSYSYGSGEPALRDISFAAKHGELIGLIGPSGSGKTTLSEIIVGLRQPSSGDYRVNGRDAMEFSRESWCRSVAVVPQFGRTITDTVEENIRFLRPELDEARVREAARAAHLLDEIEALDERFATVVGERGERGLSGGQKQRLAIARAVAGEPSLVVLDEPTSALDHEAEAAIVETISRLTAQACVIVIAHRMSTLRSCDRVLVVVDGEVEACCAPDELADHSEFFRRARQQSQF